MIARIAVTSGVYLSNRPQVNIRRRALSTSACFRNPAMSRASGPRVFKDKTADWICWRAVPVNFFPS